MKKGQINVGYKGRRIAFDGSTKLVGKAERYSTIDYKAITAYAAKAAAVPESSIEMAMEAIFDAMNYFVLNGHSVQIPYLGTFSIGVRAKTSLSEAEFSANFSKNLKGINIRFLPDTELKQMIAGTAITTTVDDEGYDSEGVIAVTSAMLGYYTQLLTANEGRPYLLGNATRAVFNGTRLSETFIPTWPVYLTYQKVGGVDTEVMLARKYFSQSYNTISVNLRAFIHDNDGAEEWLLKKLQVYAGGTAIKTLQFGNGNADMMFISAISIDGQAVAVNGNYKFEAGKMVRIKLFGSNLDSADTFKIGGTVVEPRSVNETQAILEFTPAASGNYPITMELEGALKDTYNVSFGDVTGLSISSITANGDPLLNGSTTNITVGSNYTIRIEGTGLNGLEVSEIQVPDGTVVAFSSKSDTLIVAMLSNAQAGDLKIVDDGVQIFSAAMVAVQPGVTVTGWKASESGATQSLNTAVVADADSGVFEAILVGNDVDELTKDSFTGSTGISILSYTESTGVLMGEAAQTGTVTIRHEDTTIATLKITKGQDTDSPTGDE